MKRSLEKTTDCDDDECKFIPLTKDETSWIRTFVYSGSKVNTSVFNQLWDLHPIDHALVRMRGKLIPVPRWQQTFVSDIKMGGYNFSGVKHSGIQITPLLQPYLDYANKVCAPYLKKYPKSPQFNMILLNWYENGNHYIGLHADDEKQLLKNSKGETLVFSISFGATRTFRLKSKNEDDTENVDIELNNGDALLMGGICQSTHKHCIPKISGEKGKKVGKRINLTFRIFS